MRKIIRLMMCMMLICSIFAVPVYAKEGRNLNNDVKVSDSTISPQWMNQFEVTASALSVRSGPGTSYSIVGTLYKGDTGYLYDAREISADGYTWVPIYNSSHTALWGWVAKEYIEIIG